MLSGARRFAWPDEIYDPGDLYWPVGLQRQYREDQSLLARPELDSLTLRACFYWT
jgi:hypothetical protein